MSESRVGTPQSSTDIASFEQGILQQEMSHQQGSAAFAYGLAAGLFYNSTNGELILRANQGVETGTSYANLCAASGFGGSTFTLSTEFTKTATDT